GYPEIVGGTIVDIGCGNGYATCGFVQNCGVVLADGIWGGVVIEWVFYYEQSAIPVYTFISKTRSNNISALKEWIHVPSAIKGFIIVSGIRVEIIYFRHAWRRIVKSVHPHDPYTSRIICKVETVAPNVAIVVNGGSSAIVGVGQIGIVQILNIEN